MHPTPNLSHLSADDFLCIYEPAEDTFLLLDALEIDKAFLLERNPNLALEVGSGSGCVITFLSKLLYPHPILCIATDINPRATKATHQTALANGTSAECLLTSQVGGVASRNLFDVILFNPPYVPTEELCMEAVMGCQQKIDQCKPEDLLEATWAGGINGRYWIDLLLPKIDGLLSAQGVFYMVALTANMPDEIIKLARREWNFDSTIILSRRAGLEHLVIVRFWRCK